MTGLVGACRPVCCEQVPQLVGELYVLGLRAIMPIHVICAGFQAINYVKVRYPEVGKAVCYFKSLRGLPLGFANLYPFEKDLI